MKSNDKENGINGYNKQNLFLDEFWNDCLSPSKVTETGKCMNRSKSTKSNLNENKKQKQLSKLLSSFYNNHPEIYNEEKKKKEKSRMRKQAEQRCITMFEYAKSQQNLSRNIDNQLKEQRMKSEMEECTWKPKVNKLSKKQEAKLFKIGVDIYEREQNIKYRNKYKKLLQSKSQEDENDNKNENDILLFQPKVNISTNFDKMFNKTCLENKGNYEFLIRYENARKEHIYKMNKKMSFKELNDHEISLNGTTEFKRVSSVNTSFDSRRIKSQIHRKLSELNLNNDADEFKEI